MHRETCSNSSSSSTQAKPSSSVLGGGEVLGGERYVEEVEPQALGHAQRANFSSLAGIKKAKTDEVVSVADEPEGERERETARERERERQRGQDRR